MAVVAMSTPWKADRGQSPTEAKDEDKDKDSLYPGQLQAPWDVAYTPGEERSTLGRSAEPQDPEPRVLEPPPTHLPGVCPRHSRHATKAPHKSSKTRTMLTAPLHAERVPGAYPRGSPAKRP